MATGVFIILLAAGASRRMQGRDKLLEKIGEQSLLQKIACEAQCSVAQGVFAVISLHHSERRRQLLGTPVRIIDNHDASLGMSSSIICGLQNLPSEANAAVITPADMPEIRTGHFNGLIEKWLEAGRICRAATKDGAAGNPVLFPRRYFPLLLSLNGDSGARSLLNELIDETDIVNFPDHAARIDLDTPEDWDQWRKQRKQAPE